jgi:hypothetical protein
LYGHLITAKDSEVVATFGQRSSFLVDSRTTWLWRDPLNLRFLTLSVRRTAEAHGPLVLAVHMIREGQQDTEKERLMVGGALKSPTRGVNGGLRSTSCHEKDHNGMVFLSLTE